MIRRYIDDPNRGKLHVPSTGNVLVCSPSPFSTPTTFILMKATLALFSALALLVPAIAPAQTASIAAPPLPATKAQFQPGLTLTFTAGDKTDTRDARLVALYVPAGEPPTPFLPAGPFKAQWEGNIVSALRAEVTLEADYLGTLQISLNGEPLLSAAVKRGDGRKEERFQARGVKLNKGANKLVVAYTSPAQGDALVRLLWSSKEFPTEPVPPMVFSHDVASDALRGGNRIREGRLLFAQYNCIACHDGAGLVPPKPVAGVESAAMPELAQDAPAFGEFGSRYNETWMAQWISNPHTIRPRSLMPAVFGHPEGNKVDPRAADLAAYLASLGVKSDAKPAEADVPLGGALFANLGCIACHTPPEYEGQDEHNRVPLAHVRAKWQTPALIAYLKDPQALYKWTRMPNFRLSDEEANRLAAFLLSGNQREFASDLKGDPAKGGQIVVTAGCLNCHAGLPPTTQPKLADTLKGGWTRGCLAPDDASRGTAPDFALTAEQRGALLAFAANGFDSLKQDNAAEFAQRQITNLGCTACHSRDGAPSTWSQLEGDMAVLQAGAPTPEGEGMAIAGTTAPVLTWFGEKLQADWAAKFIAGGISYKPRPWLIARMPGFGVRSEGLAHGLALDHGFSIAREPEAAVDLEKAKAGETLISENGGFNCTTCHGVGERAATAVFEAPGINLAYATERLRKGYYHRWVLHPLRIDPDTKMPRFADDEGKTPLTDFFGGKASEQFEAIWQYLRTVGNK